MKRYAITLLLLSLLVVSLAGCRKKPVVAAPITVPTAGTTAVPEDVPPPEIHVVPETEPPPELVVPSSKPAPRPGRRSAPPTPAREPEPEVTEAKPSAPRMAPRLSAVEEDAYKEKTWQAINTAEKNLLAVTGRTLTAAQLDLESKVRGFLAQAREAIGVGDWVRALNLADKAVVLSRELVGSL